MAGYLYVINPYIPLILSVLMSLLTVIIAYRFEEIEQPEKQSATIKESVKDRKEGFHFIINSKRLRALLIFMSVFVGVLMMIGTYENSLLKDLKVKTQYFGIIFAILSLVQCFSVSFQGKIHNRFRNRTLAFLSIPIFVSFIVIGIVGTLNLNYVFTLIVVIAMFFVQHFFRSPYWVLENKYITNFTNATIRVKILSVAKILKRIAKIVITFLAGLLLEYFTTSEAYFIIGSAGLVIILLLLYYMKKRVGLKPEEYDTSDIAWEKERAKF